MIKLQWKKDTFIDKDKKAIEYDKVFAKVENNGYSIEILIKFESKFEKQTIINAINKDGAFLKVIPNVYKNKQGVEIKNYKAVVVFAVGEQAFEMDIKLTPAELFIIQTN